MFAVTMSSPHCRSAESTGEEDWLLLPTPVAGDSVMDKSSIFSSPSEPIQSTWEEDWPLLPTPLPNNSIVDTSSAPGPHCPPNETSLEDKLLRRDTKGLAIKHASATYNPPCGPTFSKVQDARPKFPSRYWERLFTSPAPALIGNVFDLKELDIQAPSGSEDVTMQSRWEDNQAPEQHRKRAIGEGVGGGLVSLYCSLTSLLPLPYIRRIRFTLEKEPQASRLDVLHVLSGTWRCWHDILKEREEQQRRKRESIRLNKRSKELKVLLDFLKTLWGLLDTIIELMQAVRVYITLILNTISSGFSEFPNSMRPPCTTMPWTIWPALVVLWGVCWMFYTPLSAADERQIQLSLQDAEWTLFPSSEALFDPLRPPFLTHQDISEHSTLEDLNSLPNSFHWSNEIDFPEFSASGESNRVNSPLLEQVAPSRSLDQGFPFEFASSMDFLRAGNLAKQHLATDPADNHVAMPSPSEGPLMSLSSEANIQAKQTALPSQLSAISTQPEQPPRNSEGKIACDHVDCNSKTLIFTNPRDWSKHKNKHERPYRCTINDCTRTKGFATKGDQIRHERVVHRTSNSRASTQTNTSTVLFCDEPNCGRRSGTGNPGFNRRDNLMDHMKRRHGRVLPSSRVSMSGGVRDANNSTPPDNQRPELPQLKDQQEMDSLVLAATEKQRRIAAVQSPGMVDIENEEVNPRKRQRQEDRHESNGDMERTLGEEALMREVEKLRRELKKSQMEKDILIGVIDRLIQGPRRLEEGSS